MRKAHYQRDGEPVRILVVDDEPHVLAALIDLVEDERGVRVVGAALRVDDAIKLAILQRPDVVLLDVHMPGGGGQHVVAATRNLLPDTRIFAMAALLDRDDISTMLSAGADMCFSKTADVTTLMRSLTP
ncbi:MAG TPA: response regulator transcription factor [Nocardioidaceae bacterium]